MEMYIHNMKRLTFRNGLAWVSFLAREGDGMAGVSFTCLGGRWDRSPDYYYSNDYGTSFKRTLNYIMSGGRMRMEVREQIRRRSECLRNCGGPIWRNVGRESGEECTLFCPQFRPVVVLQEQQRRDVELPEPRRNRIRPRGADVDL
jgi:hypothetical protein